MNTILVTGGLGFIGSHTVIDLVKQGYSVIIVDNLSNASAKVLPVLEELSQKKIPFYPVDIREKKELEKIFQEHQIDAVIHFAGLKAVGESVQKPLSYYDNNLISTITLLEVMEEYSVRKLVFSSSATVYGEPEKMPLLETDLTGATSPYGRTKLWIEQILQDLCDANDAWDVVALRYFNPLGAHKSGDLGEDPKGIPNNLAPYITQVGVGKLEKLHVFGNDYPTSDGTCVRDYIHVLDLAAGHRAAITYLEKEHCRYEIFNLGSGSGFSVLEMIKSFEKAIGKEIPFVVDSRRAGDIPVSYADTKKAEDKLGWKVQKTIDEMCADAWRWQKKHPDGFEP
ncbi:UDP-glucose 4-epimerase [Clostridia bacterium]|nr:UDP-glucose 4-epimerase [Clostridia bacterium]